ncbi:uncharacterized protein LOC129579638 [Sitodiplosis mosellana]|uniref:uncharacterized protein LOC129579638 n=1 Tax=Sitodiplosis mosellana TaxID=263140 RepID=UPI00244408F4|nr:uncharacterized protein LOC129579638 [Sitodiplosis mosellana]
MDNLPITKRMRTNPPIVEQTAEIFTLNIDCLENIFDYLELQDVCTIGMTCKRMQQVAGKYFQQFYPMHRVMIGRDEQGDIVESMAKETSSYHLNNSSRAERHVQGHYDESIPGEQDSYPTNFGRFAEDLEVFGSDIEVLRYAVENMDKSLKSISLRDFTEYSPIHDEYVAKLVQNVECLTFAGACDCNNYKEEEIETKYGDDRICYDDILKHCNKLKCLQFSCDWNFNIRGKYPQIEHLIIKHPFEDEYIVNDFDMSKLKTFLEQNLHIKKLSIIAEQPAAVFLLDLLRHIDLKLDELSAVYDRVGDANGYDTYTESEFFHEMLNNLYEQDKYKELELNVSDRAFFELNISIQNVLEITKIEIFFNEKDEALDFMKSNIDDYGDAAGWALSDEDLFKRRANYIKIPSSLKYLRLKGSICAIDAATLSEGENALEYLRLDGEIESGVLDIFASHSPTLKEIIYKNDRFDVNELKLATINKNRGNLQNAQKLKIYLPEKHFLQLKWSTIELEYKFVEVKRLNEWCMKSPIIDIMRRHGGEHIRYSRYFY